MEITEALGIKYIIEEKGMSYDLSSNSNKLSGGELARIELARAIISERPIILLDEFNASLDKKTSDRIHDYLLKSRMTILEVIHHYDDNLLKRYDNVINVGE